MGERSRSSEMTLVFSLSAVERLADPEAAFDDARAWSRHLGVVDNDTEAVEERVDAHDLPQDYELGDRDVWRAMEEIRASTATSRYVYVGATEEDRRVATQLGWEFVHVTDAAEKAGWELTGGGNEDSVLVQLRNWIGKRLSFGGD